MAGARRWSGLFLAVVITVATAAVLLSPPAEAAGRPGPAFPTATAHRPPTMERPALPRAGRPGAHSRAAKAAGASRHPHATKHPSARHAHHAAARPAKSAHRAAKASHRAGRHAAAAARQGARAAQTAAYRGAAALRKSATAAQREAATARQSAKRAADAARRAAEAARRAAQAARHGGAHPQPPGHAVGHHKPGAGPSGGSGVHRPAPGNGGTGSAASAGGAPRAASDLTAARIDTGAAGGRTTTAPPKRPGSKPPASKPPANPPATNPPPGSSVGQPPKVLDPIGRLRDEIRDVTGFSLFGGPVGWILTGLLVVAVGMISLALGIGWRRRGASMRS